MKPVRTKAVVIIFSVCLVIIAVSLSAGYFLIHRNHSAALEENMTAANTLAAEMVAEKLRELDSRLGVLTEQIIHKDFIGVKLFLDSLVKDNSFLAMRIFYRDGRVICSGDDFFTIDSNAERAFRGETVIGSPKWNGMGNFVLRSYKPIDQDRILVATLSGQYISSLIDSYRIWNAGMIFILDKEGTFIASPWENRVFNHDNFLESAKYFPEFQGMADLSRRMIRGETGIAQSIIEGKNGITLYRPIPGSDGWSLGIISPIEESFSGNAELSYLRTVVVMLLLSFLTAFFCAGLIARPNDPNEEILINIEHVKTAS